MNVVVPIPGKYVVAVSGGIDSVSLLHRLTSEPNLQLVVAHYDHGIREESAEDRRFVQTLARQHRLPVVYDEGHLGAGASEATARRARHAFLRRVRQASGARAILTAHHQDDVLETAIINIMRGTGRKGLTALGDHHNLHRPLANASKQHVAAYAKHHNLQWHEDITNQNTAYLRNHVRLNMLAKFSVADREKLLQLIETTRKANQEIDTLLVNYLHTQSVGGQLDRLWFNHLPHPVARETMASWLRANGLRSFDRPMLERLVVAAKTSSAGKQVDSLRGWRIQIGKANLALQQLER